MDTYAPPPSSHPTSAPQGFAGFWIRAGAALLDSLLLTVISSILSMLLPLSLAQLITLIAAIGYYAYFQGGPQQATPGKRLLGIYVMRTNGETLSYGRAAARYLASLLSGLLLGIGFIMVAFTQDKTALHDLIVDTRVVHGKR